LPAASFVLADMDTGKILVARTPHVRHLPASTLKTLTALTLIPLLDPNKKIMVKPEDVRVQGTHVGILSGTSYTVDTLLQGMLITSGNDAAYALARGNDSLAVTLAQMNVTAAGLNAMDTVAKDPSGLDKRGQSSSAYDLALIGRAAMKLPSFRKYVSTKNASLPGGRTADGKRKPGFKISNHNKLIFNYPGAIGIKNGYTVAAKFTYVEAATRGGKTYLLTEMASTASGWRPSAAMLDWAFAHGTSVTPIGELVEPGKAVLPKPKAAPAVAGVQAPPATPLLPLQPALPFWVGMAGVVGVLALARARARQRAARRRL
jgi:D-alanyl-D-alanine carboxypeptidase (penicillin-binding protein 5/6)